MAITDTDDDAVRFVAAVGGLRFGQEMTAGEIFTRRRRWAGGRHHPGWSGLLGRAHLARRRRLRRGRGSDHRRHRQRRHPLRPGAWPARVFGMAVQPGHIYTIAGNMNYGYSGNGGLGTSAELQLDTFNGVAVDSKGDVVFSDVDNQVVRLVAAATGTAFGHAVIAGRHLHDRGDRDRGVQRREEARHQGLAGHTPGGGHRRGGQPLHQRLGQQPDPSRAFRQGHVRRHGGQGGRHLHDRRQRHRRAVQRIRPASAWRPTATCSWPTTADNVIREIAGTPPGPPTVTAIKPTSGPTSGDRKVTIKGSNLSGTTAVMFGSRPATSFTVRSAKKIIAYSPIGTLGTVAVKVYSPAGVSGASSIDTYTYQVAATTKHKRRR